MNRDNHKRTGVSGQDAVKFINDKLGVDTSSLSEEQMAALSAGSSNQEEMSNSDTSQHGQNYQTPGRSASVSPGVNETSVHHMKKAQTGSGSGILNFVSSSDVVDLPSHGKYYPSNHPLFGAESMEIKEMTAVEEDILTNTSLIKKGIVLDRLLDAIIVDKRIDPLSMLSGDRNACLFRAKISAQGPDHITKYGCPSCGEKQNYAFDLEQAMENAYNNNGFSQEFLNKYKIVETQNNTWRIPLPKTKAIVEVRPLTGYDERKLIEIAKRNKKIMKKESSITDQFRLFIVSINDSTDRASIIHAITQLPARDSVFLRAIYTELVPNVELRGDFKCQECDHQEEVTVPLGPDFFWSKPRI